MSSLAERVIRTCREIAACTEEPGRTTRTFLSPPMREVHRILGDWMGSLGMQVRVDAAGNLRGLHGDPHAPRLLIGSHLDTVPDAGAFDGILGVVLGVAMVEARPGIGVEVVGFSEEEGVRFGFPFIGSRALTGTLDLAGVDPGIAEAIRTSHSIRNGCPMPASRRKLSAIWNSTSSRVRCSKAWICRLGWWTRSLGRAVSW